MENEWIPTNAYIQNLEEGWIAPLFPQGRNWKPWAQWWWSQYGASACRMINKTQNWLFRARGRYNGSKPNRRFCQWFRASKSVRAAKTSQRLNVRQINLNTKKSQTPHPIGLPSGLCWWSIQPRFIESSSFSISTLTKDAHMHFHTSPDRLPDTISYQGLMGET